MLIAVPLLLAVYVLGLSNWDLSIPLIYRNADDIWQLTLTKVLHDTGWVLINPYLGAPGVASWHHNAAAQTSALHSVLMLAMSPFIQDPVRLQQVYYLLNFPLISITSFIACRLLGVSRLPAFCVGLLFAFTTFRINEMLYAFLTNYFMVPLALVAVIWVLSGKFAALVEEQECPLGWPQAIACLLRTREFVLGLLFVALTASSDGYYAFFTLLLLGFAAFGRILLGDWRRPLSLLPVAIYIFTLMAVSLSLELPLYNYKKTHWNEFYPNGIEDPALVKHPFEAEVYSSTLKMMIAPIPHHHIERLGRIGQWVVETSDGARLFKNGRNLVPLGTLGSLLFGVVLLLLALPALQRRVTCTLGDAKGAQPSLGEALLSLSLFIFLCSILGGIGTLVALVFPTIRSYDRFPLFLIFVLLLGAALFMTQKLQSSDQRGRAKWAALLLVITAIGLYDQIPRDAHKGNEQSKAQFLAERTFVHNIEAILPPNAMVYQFPYSQYLRENKYYGWGSFSHIRLYLHSHHLRWSNGGAKNSPADDWNYRISQLSPEKLIAEVEAVGFSGFVIDRSVVNNSEYETLRRIFISHGYKLLEDAPSKFTFVQLQNPGFQLFYDPMYREADHIVVTDSARLLARSELPNVIQRDALKRFLDSQQGKSNIVIRKADHPEIFVNASIMSGGLGQTTIAQLSDMHGKMNCKVEPGNKDDGADTLVLTIKNESIFDWRLGDGSFPIRIGVHIRQPDGHLLQWDDGYRVPSSAYINQGTSHTIRMQLNTLPLSTEERGKGPLVAEFALVQDGNAWFGNINCLVPLH
jgi:hypothetical protein